jgi:enamine deaminase RidA (YjgF/YER057c/UK114 family)
MPYSTIATPEAKPVANYKMATRMEGGRLLYISGQVAWDASGTIVGKGDLRAQAVQVYENLKAALAAADAGLGDVVKMTTFVVDLTPEKAQIIREVRGQYLPEDHRPASTMVGVTSLVSPDLLVEIEVVAALTDRR